MTLTYTAPLDEMRFVLKEVFDAPSLWQNTPALSSMDGDTVDMILDEMAKFSQEVLLPINQSGDNEGATYLGDGAVATPTGFKEAFANYAEMGWIGLGGDPEFGGQGMPKMVSMLCEEMLFASNQAFALYPNLTIGASICLIASGSDEQKHTYLPKLYEGTWTGTMCLTEAHAGTDLGLIKTKAVPNADGSYAITGSKIFITAGEHDLSENIIHLVLAKTPDAPAGSKGISLFIVPKFLINADGSLGQRNGVQAGAIEHKMGIKASATCVMNFDNATGYLVGAENSGLANMFVMMNYERLTMGLQGLGASTLAYQNALAYAFERQQSRADGVAADTPAPIICHADVRRMLLNTKANSVASRAFAMYVARELDIAKFADDPNAKAIAHAKVALLTPVVKAFLTDRAFEATIDCQQVFGGHGYIKEWGMEQIVRDTRISQIYEGTNGIQALDLLGRKVIKDHAKTLNGYLDEIKTATSALSDEVEFKSKLLLAVDEFKNTTADLFDRSQQEPNLINGVATDYLAGLGYLSYGYMFVKIYQASHDKQGDFYANQCTLAKYFFARIFGKFNAHLSGVKAGVGAMMAYQF